MMSDARLVFSEDEANKTAAAPTNVSCPTCGGTRPTCCSCPDLAPVAQPEADPVDNHAAVELLDKWLAEHPHVEHDEHLEHMRRMVNENSLSAREHCPSTTTPTTAAAEAAREIAHSITNTEIDWARLAVTTDPEFEAGQKTLSKLAAIISKHLPAQQPEVEPHGDLTLEEEIAWRRERDVSILASMKAQGEWIERLKGEVERLREGLRSQRQIIKSWQNHALITSRLLGCPAIDKDVEAAIDKLKHDAATARADAIGEAVERIKAEHLHEDLDNESDRGYQNAIEHMVAALEQLKGEGSEG